MDDSVVAGMPAVDDSVVPGTPAMDDSVDAVDKMCEVDDSVVADEVCFMCGGSWSESGEDWTCQSHRGMWKTDRDGGSWSESGEDWTCQSHRGLWKTDIDGGS